MKIRSLLVSILMLSLLAPIVGQQPTPKPVARPAAQEDVERVTINLVQIDVVVTDKDGQQVTDLRPEEIEILENGKRQPITNFSYISAVSAPVAAPPPTGAPPSAPAKNASTPVMPARLPREQVRRTMALVVDDLGLSFESIGFVQKALKKFVDEQMQPGDLVAILRTSSSVGALQQFTSDKRLLYAAIERVRWYPQGRGGLSPTTTLNEESAGSDFRDTVQFNKEMEEARAGIYSVGTFGTVSDIVKGLGEMPGRKSLVFISEAFRLFSAQGRNVQLVTAMRRLTDDANAASVSIYTMDASGLQTDAFQASDKEGARAYVIDPQVFAMTGGANNAVSPNAPPRTLQRADTLSAQAEQDSVNAFRRLNALMDQRRDARIESQTVLSYLASNTGGLFMKNRNDLGAAMQRIMDDQKGYYLIGYRPDASAVKAATDRPLMRNLSLKVKRPGLTWRTRSGYFGFAEGERRRKPRTREEQLAAALVSPFASGDVRLRLTSLFGTEPESGATYLRSLLHIDARDLLFKEVAGGGRVADVEMIAVAFGNNGQAVDQLSYPQTVRANSDEEYQRLLQSGLVYVLNFPMKQAGAYQMRVAVRDSASERTGAAMQFVEVPDLDKKYLALSGIVLSGLNPASPGNINAPSQSGAEAATDVQTGAAVRRLRQGLLLDYRYNIYNAQLDATGRPQLQTQMRLFRAGQTAFTGKLLPFDPGQQRDMKRLNAIGRLRIGPELAPGEYALQVTVTDNLASPARRTATQWIDFEIVQ